MQLCELLKLVDFLSFVVDEHLKEQSLPLFRDKVMHWFIDLNSVFDCILRSLDKARLGLVTRLIFILFTQLPQLTNSNSLLFDSLLPNLQVFISLLLLTFAFLLLLLHPEDLDNTIGTSASSGIANGLSYLGTAETEGRRGRLPRLDYSSDSLFLIEVI